MKRFVFTAIILANVVGASAQIPQVSEPVCAHCGARFTKGESHKPSCPCYEEPSSSEESQSTQDDIVWDDPSQYVTDEFNVGLGDGRTCPECGRDHHLDNTNCGIARLQNSEVYWHNEYMISKRKKRKEAEAKRDEIEAKLKKRYEYYLKNPVNASTKLKDHTPMPERRPEKPTSLIPKLDKMPPPVLPTTIQMVGVKERANDGTTTVYDKRIQFRSDYSVVFRGITQPNGTETWTMYKLFDTGDEVRGTFSKVTTIDEGDLNRYFVCCDMNGKWGLYDLYGNKKLDHEFSSIEAIPYNSWNDERDAVIICCRDGKYGLLGTYSNTVTCEYDDILLEAECDLRVKKDGKYGILDITSNRTKIPAEYTYIERISYQGVPEVYYIVSKDNVNYAVYSNTYKYPKEDYTLGEAREKVKSFASVFLK